MKLASLAHGYIGNDIELIESEIRFRAYILKGAIKNFELQNQHAKYAYEEMIDLRTFELIHAMEHKQKALRGNMRLDNWCQ